MIDLHCHILPGIDDGARDLAESADMCRLAVGDGITDIVATPHYLDGHFDPDPRIQNRKVNTLNAALREAGFNLTIHRGAEVHLVPNLADMLRHRPELRIASTRYVLIELPLILPQTLNEELFRIRLAGLVPILAHIERYEDVQRDPHLLFPLIQSGVLTQITAQSLTGEFGDSCRICAETLVKYQYAHILATDAHSRKHRPPILSRAGLRIQDLAGQEAFRAMTVIRPEAILQNEPLNIPEPLPGNTMTQPGLLSRLTAWL